MEQELYSIRPINGKLAMEPFGGLMIFNKIEQARKKMEAYAKYYKNSLPNWEIVKIKIEKL